MSGRTLPSVAQSRGVAHERTRLSVVWIIPIVAAAAGLWVAVTRILSEGPDVTITLSSAEGIEAGNTRIRYQLRLAAIRPHRSSIR
jgi:paraquat-inducible protein B